MTTFEFWSKSCDTMRSSSTRSICKWWQLQNVEEFPLRITGFFLHIIPTARSLMHELSLFFCLPLFLLLPNEVCCLQIGSWTPSPPPPHWTWLDLDRSANRKGIGTGTGTLLDCFLVSLWPGGLGRWRLGPEHTTTTNSALNLCKWTCLINHYTSHRMRRSRVGLTKASMRLQLSKSGLMIIHLHFDDSKSFIFLARQEQKTNKQTKKVEPTFSLCLPSQRAKTILIAQCLNQINEWWPEFFKGNTSQGKERV